jgi:tRNA (adenine57-N1/adenine58-N1)-methyltransferase catalytic subunit
VSGADFRFGDRVQLTGPKGQLHTVTLTEGGGLHTHRGVLWHAAIVGQPEGSVLPASNGDQYLALRPLLADYVMSMPRGAAIIYPKDAAQIIGLADIHPGATVVEAGVGSGALSLWLLRAIGAEGRLVSFERRAEFADIARGNVAGFLGEVPANWEIALGDLADELPARDLRADRVILDMLTP